MLKTVVVVHHKACGDHILVSTGAVGVGRVGSGSEVCPKKGTVPHCGRLNLTSQEGPALWSALEKLALNIAVS